MTLAQAGAIAAILTFLGFVMWGRSAGGRASLGPLLQQPEPPSKAKRTTRPAARQTKAVASTRKPTATTPSPKAATPRRATAKPATKKRT